MNDQTAFFTLVSAPDQRQAARLLIDGIHTFAKHMRGYPIWIFVTGFDGKEWVEFTGFDVEVIPLTIPDSIQQDGFAGKVCACAQAEKLAGSSIQSLVWISSNVLVLQPPVLLELGPSFDAAFRPVHVRNIGLRAVDPLDEFWWRVYQAAGVEDVQINVESFVDSQCLRAYYNSHAFAINPSTGLMRQWLEIYESLVCDQDFQSRACRDELHQIFLHQAVLSALISTHLDPERICILPPDYNYPYNLQDQIPVHKRSAVLNDLVSIAYEDRSLNPKDVKDIRIDEPLRSWLSRILDNTA